MSVLAQHGITMTELYAKAAQLEGSGLAMFDRMVAARENGRRLLRKQAERRARDHEPAETTEQEERIDGERKSDRGQPPQRAEEHRPENLGRQDEVKPQRVAPRLIPAFAVRHGGVDCWRPRARAPCRTSDVLGCRIGSKWTNAAEPHIRESPTNSPRSLNVSSLKIGLETPNPYPSLPVVSDLATAKDATAV
jgi:hypothetical protein